MASIFSPSCFICLSLFCLALVIPAPSADPVWCMVYDNLCHAPWTEDAVCRCERSHVVVPLELEALPVMLRGRVELSIMLGIDNRVEW